MKSDIEKLSDELGELKEEVKGLSIFKNKALKVIGFLTGISIVLGIIGVWEYFTIAKFKEPTKPIQKAIYEGKTTIEDHIRKEVNKITFPKGIDASGNVTISGDLSVSKNAKITGNVGIGTNSPSAKLNVRSYNKTGGICIDVDSDDLNHSALLEFRSKKSKGAYVGYYPADDLLVLNNLSNDFYLTKKGNVCIGGYIKEWATDKGGMRRLMVSGYAQKRSNDTPIVVDIARFQGSDSNGNNIAWIDFDSNGRMITASRDLIFRTSAGVQDALILREQGYVVVKKQLEVEGPIYHRGNKIYSDFVFDPDYKLLSIDEQSRFMWKNKHLPAIPKMKVDDNGNEFIEIGEHQRGIVEELEKAHIYISRLNEALQKKDRQIASLMERVRKLESAAK